MNGIYTAIIIEPRRHPAMKFVLDSFLSNLDRRWNFIIFHGIENSEWIKTMINDTFNKDIDRITLVNLNIYNLSHQQYNKLCATEEFINKIPTETFLIFQVDTMICSQEKDLIYEFIDYDYVGAPWSKEHKANPGCGKVGNGGLSLRKKSKMLEIIRSVPYRLEYHEDTYFCVVNTKIPLNVPDWEKAKLFSIETVYSSRSFGLHQAWNFQDSAVLEKQFEGYNELVKLNKK
jgi:hypothetical protein